MTRYAIMTEIAELRTGQARIAREQAALYEAEATKTIIDRDLLPCEQAEEEIEV